MTIILPATYKCKNCNNLMLDHPTLSGNCIDAVVYSDCFIDGPMTIPFDDAYIVCSKCRSVYERDEIFLKFMKSSYRGVKDKCSPPIGGFEKIKIIIKSNHKSIKRKYVLLWYLWNINHDLDENTIQKEKDCGDYDRYTNEELEILSKQNDQESILLLAEILREMGHFDQAVHIFKNTKFTGKLKKVAKQILDKALKKEKEVFIIH